MNQDKSRVFLSLLTVCVNCLCFVFNFAFCRAPNSFNWYQSQVYLFFELGMTGSKVEIEKFDGQRFELWKVRMEDLLVDRDLWGAITTDRPTFGTVAAMTSETSGTATSTTTGMGTVKASGGELSAADRAALAEWDKMDRKAKGLIRMCIEDKILANVVDQHTAKGL